MQTKRLNMIISHIDAKRVADVGTDHGYIPVQLALGGIADKVIATDLNKGPLDAARSTVKANGCEKFVECRLGSGLSPIGVGECDAIVIAGMGGELISEILKEEETVAKAADKLLLQPMNSQDTLRRFLLENGYEITEEDLTVEGFKVYNLIIARKGIMACPSNEFELHLPRVLYGHKHFGSLLAKKKREFGKILSGLERATERNDEEIKRYTDLLERVERLEEEYAGF